MTIALLTDFGTQDGFVGAMKGVIQSINPGVPVIDLSHEVQPFNVPEGALLLKAHYRYFPPGTVFVAVVDPGVGSERKPIAMRLGEYFFVGPDNGIFDLVVREFEGPPSVVILENKKLQLPKPNNTFHGRDIFAPAGAYISRGVPLEEFGRSIEYKCRLNFPEVRREKECLIGQIIHFDRFGNAITNIPCGEYSHAEFRGEKLKIAPYFQAGDKEKLNAVCGSFGFMELFVPTESAREKFKLKEGEEVCFLA
ncbi:MAG: SAM-dependent chlorinase/fluorinase [Aquificae bacterium]|nr:SAM-dependent chlorinase/fluorinase [Aquificota bacterium]